MVFDPKGLADPSGLIGRLNLIKRTIPYLELACGMIAAALWYTRGSATWHVGAWPLILLAIPLLLRLVTRSLAFRPTVFDVLLWAFLASAATGVWAAYNPGPAWDKFWLIVGAVGLYYALARQPDSEHLYVALALLGLLGIGLSFYFFMANDWTTAAWVEHTAKAPALVSVGKQISTSLPALPKQNITPDVLGGILAALMPVVVALVVLSRVTRRWLSVVWLVGLAVVGMAWLVSTSRGAWFAVLGVAGIWAVWHGSGWWVSRRKMQADRAWAARWLILVGSLFIGSVSLAAALFIARSGRLPALDGWMDRLLLWRDGWLLARDYAFTGVGLGMFPMQYSIYTLLIHVLYLPQAYNVVLDLLINQGLVGLVSYALLVSVVAVWGLRRLRQATGQAAWIIETGLASLGVMVVNGLLSDAVYGSRGILLLFMPLGLVMAAGNGSQKSDAQRTGSQRSEVSSRRWAVGATVVVAAGVALAALLFVGVTWQRQLTAAWYANLGALEQSRVELSAYDPNHFDNPTLDQVRQRANLDRATALFEQAAQIDPANPTARQRLATIKLSRGQYASALYEMQATWDAGHHDAVTRKLLGDAYVANGRVKEAAQLVQGLAWADGRLAGQAWYRYEQSHDYQRAADAWAAVVLLKPGDASLVAAQAEAARQVGQ